VTLSRCNDYAALTGFLELDSDVF